MSKNTLMTKESYVNPIGVKKENLYTYEDDDDKRQTNIVRKMLLTPKVVENS